MKNHLVRQKEIVVLFFYFFLAAVCPEVFAALPLTLTPQDRVLILAPHPDDEAIGTGGVIQRAVGMGIPLKVVYLTNGENNQLAFIVYKKHPVLNRSGLLKMGEIRRQEAVMAMQSLGVPAEQLIFLGYPDFGTNEIFTKYWGRQKPFRSMLARVSSVPYPEAYSYNAPYQGESILRDITKIIKEYQPTKIFVTLPADTNFDHRAFYLFLQVALWDLEGKIPVPEIYPYIVHVAKWPSPRGFHPDLPLEVPERLENSGLDWSSLDLTPGEISKKRDATRYYRSQNAYNPRYLPTFARKNELFGRFRDIILEDKNTQIAWEDCTRPQTVTHLIDENKRSVVQSVSYAQQNGKLFVRLVVNRQESEVLRINIFLIGYRKETDFAQMPKIRINVNFDRFVSVFDRFERLQITGMTLTTKNNVLLIEIPLSALGDPDKILSSVKTYIADWPLEATAWRTLIVDKQGRAPSLLERVVERSLKNGLRLI
ncbi:MAG: PIG-L family deacetylase [Candidatus Omnitrophica bacterium]|nr:PIG-L family deacetylase [Candidatus Omnitrophota bacterium]